MHHTKEDIFLLLCAIDYLNQLESARRPSKHTILGGTSALPPTNALQQINLQHSNTQAHTIIITTNQHTSSRPSSVTSTIVSTYIHTYSHIYTDIHCILKNYCVHHSTHTLQILHIIIILLYSTYHILYTIIPAPIPHPFNYQYICTCT